MDIDVIHNTTVVYIDNVKENFDAIRIIEKGIMIGKIIDNRFEPFGFIPRHSIMHIFNEQDKKIF
jgi:hypothetical protein